MKPPFYDAHNHLQDKRLKLDKQLWEALESGHVAQVVVNGSSEEDWPSVLELAKAHPDVVIPSFGYHPWYVKERTKEWKSVLIRFLEAGPAGVGEIGLDCWIKNHDITAQEEVFTFQMRLAAERGLPVSIHCLKAWGRLFELLRIGPRPQCGFVLHSFGGPKEMVPSLSKLGAYFSLPGYFAHERKLRQRETFLHVPPERLLIETDAPDQSLPPGRVKYALPEDAEGRPLNHPANIAAVYEFAAELYQEPLDSLARRVEENFLRVFRPILAQKRVSS